MNLLKFILLFVLISAASAQGLRGFFDTLARPFSGLAEGFRRIFPKPIANLPDNERLDKSNCKCRLSASSRIVGGQEVNEIIPWQANLLHSTNQSLFCGGTVINNYFIITTAHCTDTKKADQILVRLGVTNIKDDDGNKTYEVEKILQDSYSGINDAGDIAILKLSKPIQFQEKIIEPACLNLVRVRNYKNELMASGFGTTVESFKDPNGTYFSGETSETLKKAYFFEDKTACRSFLICINSKDGSSACNGDSGGPLHYLDQGITTVEGAASFVRGKGRRTKRIYLCTGFAGYSRFSYYANWIESIVGKEYCVKDDPISKN